MQNPGFQGYCWGTRLHMEDETEDQQNETQFEALIQGLIDNDYGYCDDFLNAKTVIGLREKLICLDAEGEMKRAGIGKDQALQTNDQVRGDEIKWIENDSKDQFERIYLRKVADFILYLNKTCYASINEHESHYASYAQNTFYKRHKDQFKDDSKRKFSLVLYLNEEWLARDEGVLSLYLDSGIQKDILPLGGRLVFFRSEQVAHEVHPSQTKVRRSIAGWLKSS